MSVQDELCDCLRNIGVNAQIAEPSLVKHVEGVIGASIITSYKSGTVDIPDGPIRWCNLMEQQSWGPSPGGTKTNWFMRYGVPDQRLSLSLPEIKIKPKLKKRGLLGTGGVVDMQWEGKDGGIGIIDRLSSDVSLKSPIMNTGGDVEIRAYRRYGCWLIRTSFEPSEELWNCYQSIAQHLLIEWPSSKPR